MIVRQKNAADVANMNEQDAIADATNMNEQNTEADVINEVAVPQDTEQTIAPPQHLTIGTMRTCNCIPSHMNCMNAKEWMKSQIGLWEFFYEKRDIRDKKKHPAVFPISLARKCIDLFSHQGELIIDPFMGSGTTLLAARDAGRNAVGFDIHPDYIALTQDRLAQQTLFGNTQQIPVLADARNIAQYLNEESITCIVTSPPYANLLNRERKNKSMRGDLRKNDQYNKIEQYSQRTEDLGTLQLEDYAVAMAEIFGRILPLMKRKGHVVINVPDMWWENKRITIHIAVIEAMRSVGFELRNTIIWNRNNIVNNVGIFGWPNNYITMGTTFEYILDFWRPPVALHQTHTGEIIPDENVIEFTTTQMPEHIKPKKTRKRKEPKPNVPEVSGEDNFWRPDMDTETGSADIVEEVLNHRPSLNNPVTGPLFSRLPSNPETYPIVPTTLSSDPETGPLTPRKTRKRKQTTNSSGKKQKAIGQEVPLETLGNASIDGKNTTDTNRDAE